MDVTAAASDAFGNSSEITSRFDFEQKATKETKSLESNLRSLLFTSTRENREVVLVHALCVFV